MGINKELLKYGLIDSIKSIKFLNFSDVVEDKYDYERIHLKSDIKFNKFIDSNRHDMIKILTEDLLYHIFNEEKKGLYYKSFAYYNYDYNYILDMLDTLVIMNKNDNIIVLIDSNIELKLKQYYPSILHEINNSYFDILDKNYHLYSCSYLKSNFCLFENDTININIENLNVDNTNNIDNTKNILIDIVINVGIHNDKSIICYDIMK